MSENRDLVIEFIKENPGIPRVKLESLFDSKVVGSVRRTISMMLSDRYGSLIEKDGGLYLPSPKEEKSKPDVKPQIGVHLFQPVFEETIDVPQLAKGRNLLVLFQIEEMIKDVKRIGVSNVIQAGSIIWLPPGRTSLRVKIGQGPVDSSSERVNVNYLCLVVPSKAGGWKVKYFQAPEGEKFVLSWDE